MPLLSFADVVKLRKQRKPGMVAMDKELTAALKSVKRLVQFHMIGTTTKLASTLKKLNLLNQVKDMGANCFGWFAL